MNVRIQGKDNLIPSGWTLCSNSKMMFLDKETVSFFVKRTKEILFYLYKLV